MDIFNSIVSLAAIIAGGVTSFIYALVAYRKSKEPPKDEIWETAVRLLSASGNCNNADDFAHLYQELKAFKDNGCSLGGNSSVLQLMKLKNKENDHTDC